MRSINNDQNINRVYTKMSEDFHDENNAKLSKCVKSVAYFDEINSVDDRLIQEEINVNDHMYASNTENDEINEVSSSDANCQTAESEVKFLKEWLILHTDLIQQQNDDILDRDRQIYILRKENEMLKERINCIEKGTPFQSDRVFKRKPTEDSEQATPEDMTQGPCEEDTKENIEIIEEQFCDNEECSVEVINYQENHVNLSDNESQLEASLLSNDNNFSVEDAELELKSEEYILNEIDENYKDESDAVNNCDSSISDYNFTINNISDLDPMKNLRMSIRRKRVCSNSSVLSHNEPAVLEEKQTYRRFKKRGDVSTAENNFCITKDSQILTSSEPYVTQAHEVHLGITSPDPDLPDCQATTLEVKSAPMETQDIRQLLRWRAPENLDDEVYNKRHMRLENDERRRKRWDVQRIREQRVIEKLKQRQERVASGSKGDDSEPLQSLWPKVEDVRYLEVSEELPVSAFGYPVPKITPSEFNLPWISNPTILAKKPHARRSTVKEKAPRDKTCCSFATYLDTGLRQNLEDVRLRTVHIILEGYQFL
ncbi:hypothetical protein NQ318_019861 [Aromia moschata]|uniref:PEHE domain-containing protein n=1 Tax=Aromia moschata TaxID=1265417 RepID=A0AAV8YLZ2_9CUCU|nr:hypothetical protein NQ318_019861 [Aromia moschata]